MENKNRQSTGSLFLSIPGLIIIAVCLAVGLYFKATIVSTFLLLFLILCLIAFFWSRQVAKQLFADARVVTSTVFPGEEVCIETTLRNDGSLGAIWTDLYLPITHPALLAPKQGAYTDIEMTQPEYKGQALHQKYTWVSGHQQLTAKQMLTAKSRGILTIPHIYLSTGDGFGIGNSRCGNAPTGDCTIIIYPKLYPVNLNQLLLKGSAMNPSKHGAYDDVTLLKNVRPYQHGDSFKRINWRMLAKQQDVMVNLYEQITPESIFFLLDLNSFSYQQRRPGGSDNDMMDCVHQDELELAISLIASCITALSEQGVACGLIIPGYESADAVFFYGENNSHRLDEILLLLAGISYSGSPASWPGEQLELLTSGVGKSYIITKSMPDAHLMAFDFMETAGIITVDAPEENSHGFLNIHELMIF